MHLFGPQKCRRYFLCVLSLSILSNYPCSPLFLAIVLPQMPTKSPVSVRVKVGLVDYDKSGRVRVHVSHVAWSVRRRCGLMSDLSGLGAEI